MIYDISDYDEFYIYVTNGWQEWYIDKVRMAVFIEGDFVTVKWNESELSPSVPVHSLYMDYNDVTFGYSTPSSASEVDLVLQQYRRSQFAPPPPTPIAYSRIIGFTGNITAPGLTGENLVWGFEIPAGTLSPGDMIEIDSIWKKTSGSGSTNFYVKIHSATGTGGSVHGVYGLTATQYWRNNAIILMTGASTQAGSGNINSISTGVGGGDYSTNTLALASSIFVNLTCSKVTAADGVELRMATIKIHKYIAP